MYIYIYTLYHIYIYICVCVCCVCVEIIDCGEYDSVIEICGKLNKSNNSVRFGIKRTKYPASKLELSV